VLSSMELPAVTGNDVIWAVGYSRPSTAAAPQTLMGTLERHSLKGSFCPPQLILRHGHNYLFGSTKKGIGQRHWAGGYYNDKQQHKPDAPGKNLERRIMDGDQLF